MVEKKEWRMHLTQFTTIIHVLFVSNCLFLLMSSIFFFHLWFIPLTTRTVIWFLLTALTLTPALSAIFYVIWKYLKAEEVQVFQQFMYSYKKNFKLALVVGSVYLLIGSIFLFNFVYVKNQQMVSQLWLIPIVIILASLTMTLIYQLVILARFNVDYKSLVLLSWVYLVKYWTVSLRNLAIILIASIMAQFIPVPIRVSLLTSVLVLGLLVNMKKILIDLEKESRDNQNNNPK